MDESIVKKVLTEPKDRVKTVELLPIIEDFNTITKPIEFIKRLGIPIPPWQRYYILFNGIRSLLSK